MTTTFHRGDCLLNDRSPLAAKSATEAAQTALSTCNKLMSRRLRPFRVRAVRTHPLVIDEHDIDNVVSVDCATRALHARDPVLTDDSSLREHSHKGHKDRLQFSQCKLKTASAEEAPHGNATPEHTVDRLARHVATGDIIRYVVQWYEHTANHDTTKPPQHILQHFIASFLSRKKTHAKCHPRSASC